MFRTFGVASLERGYSAFPIPPGGKKTLWKRWSQWCARLPTQAEKFRWINAYPEWSVAIACGAGVFAIDIDEEDNDRSNLLHDLAFNILGKTPLVRIGSAPRRILVYQAAGVRVSSSRWPKTDLLGHGRYFVASGIHPITKRPYRWVGASPSTVALKEVPVVDIENLNRFRCVLDAFYGKTPEAAQPAAPVIQNRIRGVNAGPWTTDANGLVIDGRDSCLARLVWQAFVDGKDSDEVGTAAWSEFKQRADLNRNARDGQRPWSKRDAISKARALSASGKVKRQTSGQREREHGYWTEPTKRAFDLIVTKLGAAGKLSPAQVKVSTTMLGLVYGDGTCFASVETLAADLGLAIDTIKKARGILRSQGLWLSAQFQGGRGQMAFYRPNPAALATALYEPVAITVDEIPTMIFQGEGGDLWEDLLLKPK